MAICIISVLNVLIVSVWRQCSRGGVSANGEKNKQRVPIVGPNGLMIQSTVIPIENNRL